MVSLITEKLKQQSLDDAGEPTGWRQSPQRRNSYEQVPYSSGDAHSSIFPLGKPKTSPGYGHSYEQMSSPPRPSQGAFCGAVGGAYSSEALPGSPPFIPKKRHCRSMSVTEGLPRPIALRPPPVGGGGGGGGGKSHSHLHSRLYSHGQARCSPGGRPLQSPYHRRSAFTPTRPALVSPLGGSSDCSSPCSSPVPRPASVSSGYFESSTNSLVESSSLPDLGWSGSPTQRCRSQPTFDAAQQMVSAGCAGGGGGAGGMATAAGPGGATCQLRAGNKRRHRPVSLVWERDTAVAASGPSTGPAGQRKGQVVVVPQWNRAALAAPTPCHQVYYFGSSRSYLVGLPRILSSPSTGDCSGHSSTVVDDEDSTAANSGSPESTTAHPSVPGPGPPSSSSSASSSSSSVSFGSAPSLPPMADSSGPVPPGAGVGIPPYGVGVGAAAGGFAAIAEAAEDSGCSDIDDGEEEDPPQIICSPNLDNVMLFRPVLPSTTIPQFQELDLDQIEND